MTRLLGQIVSFLFDTPRTPPMKFGQIRDQFVTDESALKTAGEALDTAKANYQAASTSSGKSTSTFAGAIAAKGGEVSDVAAVPPVTYRSNGLTITVVPLVTMDDEVPDAPPATDPGSSATS